MPLGGGDQLAKGVKSAQFSSGGSRKDQITWDIAMLNEEEFLAKYPGTTQARYKELFAEYNRGNA